MSSACTDWALESVNDTRQSAVDNPRLIYRPRADATPADELAALATVYSFILRCAEAKEGTASPSSQSQTRKEAMDEPLRK